jgi:signal transduction histidine kinase
MKAPLRLLLVEDDVGDRILLRQQVVRRCLSWFIDEADSLEGARRRLTRSSYDAMIVDYSLGDGLGTELAGDSEVPYVVVSGAQDRQVVIDALRAQASDFVVKDHAGHWLEALPGTIEDSIERHRARVKRAQEARESMSFDLAESIQEQGLRRAADHLYRGLIGTIRSADHYSRLTSDLSTVGSDELAEGYQHALRSALQRTEDMLTQLSIYAHLESSEVATATQSSECLGRAVRDLQGLIGACAARVENGALPAVQVPARHLSLLFFHLLKNSLVHRGRHAPSVRVEARPEGNFWRFSVEDDGPGVALGDVERIFMPFQRGRRLGEGPEGLGLGLSIARKVVEMGGGRIWYESPLQGGACFQFTVPRATRGGVSHFDASIDLVFEGSDS